MSARTVLEAIVAIVFIVTLWYVNLPKDAPVGQYQVAQKASELKLVPTEKLTCEPITVYLPSAKEKVDLPPAIQADKNKFVLDASILPTNRHPQELVTVYDSKTGETSSLVRETAYPWMQALQTGYVGVGYGYTNGLSQRAYNIFAHEDLLAIKALRFGVDVMAYQGGSTFVGVSSSWGW